MSSDSRIQTELDPELATAMLEHPAAVERVLLSELAECSDAEEHERLEMLLDVLVGLRTVRIMSEEG